jgi:hypothetical protein
METKISGVDFESDVISTENNFNSLRNFLGGQISRKNYPNLTTKFITTHKNACRVAKFSPDG